MNLQLSETVQEIREILSRHMKDLPAQSAIGFSGGLDSTVLMVASDFSLKAYTAGVTGSVDLVNSRSAAARLGFNTDEIVLSGANIMRYARIIRELDPGTENNELGYEVVLASVLENIVEDTLVTGQGADEIFYGYRRFIDDPSLTNEAHMEKLFRRTLARESRMAQYFGKHLSTPYLSDDMLRATRELKREDNISGSKNKIVLRYVAASLGIPVDIRERPKKAAQYGSGANKIILRSIRRGAV